MSGSETKTKLLRFFWGLIPWLIVALILAVVVILVGRIREKQSQLEEAKIAAMKNTAPPVKVITLTLEPRRLEDKINLPGEVEPHENLWFKAEVPGQVVEVLVDEGQRVERGQVLVKLDDRDYRTRLARIEANLRLAMLDYERNAVLAKKEMIAAAKLDEIEARVKDLTAQKREARLALNRTRIAAPISGRVNELEAEKGELLAVGDEVAQILQFDRVKVTVGVPESDVAAVFDLDEAEVIIEALDGLTVRGKKIFLSRKPRSLARLYDLELSIPNPDGRILPGMFARVELVKGVFEHALAVPLYAVITQGNDHFVYVEKDGRAEKRFVELGVLVGWKVQVTAGLDRGERVIIVGHRLVDNGQAVEVIKNATDPEEVLRP